MDFAVAGVAEEVFQLRLLLARDFDFFEFALAEVGDFPRLAFVFHDDDFVARVRRAGEAEDFHRGGGAGFFEFVAVFVQHGADATIFHAGEHDVAFFDDAGLHQHGGDAAATTVKAGLNHDAASHAGGRCGQLQYFGLDEHFVEQVVDAFATLGRNVGKEVFPAPFFGDDAVLGELGFDAFGVGIRFVHFVHRDDERHFGGVRVLDGLDGLRHDAVVGGNHEDDDVGRVRAARTHGGEGGVAGGVEEGDGAFRGLYAVGADVLGNAARLANRHFGFADVVKERGFAVVDVPHDGNDRRALDDVARVFVGFGHDLGFEVVFFDEDVLVSHFFGDERGGFLVKHLVDGDH